MKNQNDLIFSIVFGGALTTLGAIGEPVIACFRGANEAGMKMVHLAMIFAPLAAMMVQMAISRAREFEADATGAQISGQPQALASALAKISQMAGRTLNIPAEKNPAAASMFIVNPLGGLRMDRLFATHPATEDRIARLMAIDGGTRERPSSIPRSGGQDDGPWGRG